jgi:hypothetical protein
VNRQRNTAWQTYAPPAQLRGCNVPLPRPAPCREFIRGRTGGKLMSYRSDLNAARISSEKSSGCSQAAK